MWYEYKQWIIKIYVDNDFIWWISPRSLAIYFQLNFFLKSHKKPPCDAAQRNGTLQQSRLWASSSPTSDYFEILMAWLFQCNQVYAFLFKVDHLHSSCSTEHEGSHYGKNWVTLAMVVVLHAAKCNLRDRGSRRPCAVDCVQVSKTRITSSVR